MSKFFGGFALKNDLRLFTHIFDDFGIILNDYDVCGFSYGAQKALSYTLHCKSRINRLILLSPAFFNDRDTAFLDSQINNFTKNKELYLKYFYKNIGLDDTLSDFASNALLDDLQSLLYFRFKDDDLLIAKHLGIKIFIFLGGKDRIIDSKNAMEFFKNFGIVYFIKEANHLLRI